ncbi:hypothetical protein M9Y10_016009 [Tritrichomonas musculus]|uniref:Kinase n=1 Tax=Tritrichomonas musculus TaxID=1915356 RepID=A0ABR2I695_9EUKA
MKSKNATRFIREENKRLIKNESLNFYKSIPEENQNDDETPLSLNNKMSASSSMNNLDIPIRNYSTIYSMEYLKNQGGGHSGILKGRKGKYATILKPLTTDREGVFYKKIKNTPLYQCLPKFFGMKKEESNYYNNDNNADDPSSKMFKVNYWLLLQDLTSNMTSPCIADLKIGTRTCEINIPKRKQEKRCKTAKETTTFTHGVRCVDICMRQNNNIQRRWNRKDGRKMSWMDLQKALESFLVTKQRVQQFKDQLKFLRDKLVETYQMLPNMRLYSASVLIVYDGDKENSPINLKLIDFGHGYIDLAAEGGNIHDATYDDNALLGIDNLLLFSDSVLNNLI